MKRLHDLRPDDLDRVPVWRYDGDTDDTAFVHATERTELAGGEEETFIARTQFVLSNGAQFPGFCTPGNDESVRALQPVIIAPRGPVFFSFDDPPTRDFLREQWRRLGVDETEVFPIHFRCAVPVAERFITGTIEEDDLTGAA